jgi:hypothetical protein
VVLQVVQHEPVCRRLMTVPVAALSFKVVSMILGFLRDRERLGRILA